MAGMGGSEIHPGSWWEIPEGKEPLGRPCVDGRIILQLTVMKSDRTARTEFFWLSLRTLVSTAMDLRVLQNVGDSLNR